MTAAGKWSKLGWRHPLWDLVRYYCSLKPHRRVEWLEELQRMKRLKVGDAAELPIDPKHVRLFFDYLDQREVGYASLYAALRTEDEARACCDRMGVEARTTATKNLDHHQSSKAMVAAVTAVVAKVCASKGVGFDSNPQSRCVWCVENRLHVSARNLDGAIPSLANPFVIWEIKEYWGPTGGGSKMSDAVYECNLVGRELREFEGKVKSKIAHVVFIDGKIQWTSRKSDLKRLLDLTNQGLIDHLIAGEQVETEWSATLASLLG